MRDGREGEEPDTDTDAHRRAPGVLAGEVWAVLTAAGRPLNAAEVQQDDRGAVLSRFVSELSGDDEETLRRLLADHPED